MVKKDAYKSEAQLRAHFDFVICQSFSHIPDPKKNHT